MDLLATRVMLFTPANKPERFDKAQETGADGLVIDLEDAIPLAGKDEARKIAIEYFKTHQPNSRFISALRINSIKTTAGLEDLSALINSKIKPDVLVLPKVDFPEEIIIYDNLLAPACIPYIALIETARGLHHANGIANASNR